MALHRLHACPLGGPSFLPGRGEATAPPADKTIPVDPETESVGFCRRDEGTHPANRRPAAPSPVPPSQGFDRGSLALTWLPILVTVSASGTHHPVPVPTEA